MEITNDIKQILKRLRLSGLLFTLQDRVSYAKGVKLSYVEFLELVLSDEVERRGQNSLNRRLRQANLDPDHTLERFDWDAKITIDREKIKELFSLGFLERGENVIFCGPTGVGKSFLANALGHSACRIGKKVLRIRSSKMFKRLNQSKADNSYDQELISLIGLDLLIIEEFGFDRLQEQQASDLYELVVERYARTSTILSSNRHVDEWMPLFDDPVIASSVLDRLAHNAHQMIIEGESYRKRMGIKNG